MNDYDDGYADGYAAGKEEFEEDSAMNFSVAYNLACENCEEAHKREIQTLKGEWEESTETMRQSFQETIVSIMGEMKFLKSTIYELRKDHATITQSIGEHHERGDTDA